MSTEILEPTTSPIALRKEDDSSRLKWLLALAGICISIGFLPILFVHVWGLLGRPHYRFVVLLPIAVWLLVSDRNEDDAEDWSGGWLAMLSLLIGLGGLYQSCKVWSPFLGAVSAIAATPGFLWLFGGAKSFRTWSPAWVMSWIAIPLPFGWDEDLIIYLRSITTRWSGHLLDELKIPHLINGNVVELPYKSLFIADACSGVHSLYVLLGAALFIGLWLRRTWLHIILLLLSAAGLVLVENVSRIAAVAIGLTRRIDLSEGTRHELLGFALFGISLVLLLSFDRLIHFFAGEWSFRDSDWKHQRRLPMPHLAFTFVAMVVGLCFAPLGAYQLWAMRDHMPRVADLVEHEVELPELGLESLPEKIGRFERQSFSTIQRVHGDPFGLASQQWIYAWNDVSLRFSIDYPYQGIHDLCLCYEQTAWDVSGKQVLKPDELSVLESVPGGPVALARMQRPLMGSAVLIFSLTDMQGQEIAVIKDLARGDEAERVNRRFETFAGELENISPERPQLTPPFLQFHLVARGSSEIPPQTIDEIMKFFIEVRHELKTKCLKLAVVDHDGQN